MCAMLCARTRTFIVWGFFKYQNSNTGQNLVDTLARMWRKSHSGRGEKKQHHDGVNTFYLETMPQSTRAMRKCIALWYWWGSCFSFRILWPACEMMSWKIKKKQHQQQHNTADDEFNPGVEPQRPNCSHVTVYLGFTDFWVTRHVHFIHNNWMR